MAAGIAAAGQGREVHIFEKNEKLGKKVYITGKGRCNVTNSCEVEEIFSHMVTNGKFLYSSIYGFTNQDVMALLKVSAQRFGQTIVMITHNEEIAQTADRLLRIEDGRLLTREVAR